MMDKLESELAPAMDCIRAYFAPVHAALGKPADDGYFVHAILTRLAAGGEITSHIRHLPPGELWDSLSDHRQRQEELIAGKSILSGARGGSAPF